MMYADVDQRYKDISVRLHETVKARLEPLFRAIHLGEAVLNEVTDHIVVDLLNSMRTEDCSPRKWLMGAWCIDDFVGIAKKIEAATE